MLTCSALDPQLTRCGEYWTVQFRGRSCCVRHGKGIEDLSRLIAASAEGLHVLELFQEAGARSAVSAEADGLSIVRRASAATERSDVRARTAYRTRYLQLMEMLEEARENNDAGVIERYQEEIEQLLAELNQRRYVSCPDVERARKAVYNRLNAAITRLTRIDRELGAHLRRAITTGAYCYYRPDLLQCVACSSKAARE